MVAGASLQAPVCHETSHSDERATQLSILVYASLSIQALTHLKSSPRSRAPCVGPQSLNGGSITEPGVRRLKHLNQLHRARAST